MLYFSLWTQCWMQQLGYMLIRLQHTSQDLQDTKISGAEYCNFLDFED